MAKESYLAMCINKSLKAELRRVANERGHPNLTEFVYKELEKYAQKLHDLPDTASKDLPHRRPRGTYLTMWINPELRKRLLRLADADYRTLTDYVELQLQEIVSAHKNNLTSDPTVAGRKPTKSLRARRQSRGGRIAISINPQLKAELQQLANDDFRNLTNFIEFKLHQATAARHDAGAPLASRRQRRDARVTMRMATPLKARLKMLADEQSRTLTDFVEIRLHQIVAGHRKKHNGRS